MFKSCGRIDYMSMYDKDRIESTVNSTARSAARSMNKLRDNISDRDDSVSEFSKHLKDSIKHIGNRFDQLSFRIKVALSVSVISLLSLITGCTKPDELPKQPEYTVTYPEVSSLTSLKNWLPITVNIYNEDGFQLEFKLEKQGIDSLGNEVRNILMDITTSSQELSQTGSLFVYIPQDSVLTIIESLQVPDEDINVENKTECRMFSVNEIGSYLFDADNDSVSILNNDLKLSRESSGDTTYLMLYQSIDDDYELVFCEPAENFNDNKPRIITLESDVGEVSHIIYIIGKWEEDGLSLTVNQVVIRDN